MLSIIIPTLNEAETLGATLQSLQHARGHEVEVVVVDGGSVDDTLGLARPLCDRAETAPRGRAAQMNTGAALARGDVLLFLHADTRMLPGGTGLIHDALRQADNIWGRFDVRIDSKTLLLWLVGAMMNARSRWSGIATGDQAIFVRRAIFERIGGYPDIPIMEDVALSRALCKISRPVCLSAPVITSARRWEQHGAIRTILLMWQLRLAYYCGANPADLAVRYGHARRYE